MKARSVVLVVALVSLSLTGCSQLLPRTKTETVSPWDTFEEVKTDYDQICVFATNSEQLRKLGFTPQVNPNISTLSYSDILNRFASSPALDGDDLDPGVRRCVMDFEGCVAYELEQEKIDRDRYGNFWADFFNFRKKTRTTGWSFNAIILTHDSQVVFKQWSGNPQIRREEEETIPLGPIQSAGPSLLDGF